MINKIVVSLVCCNLLRKVIFKSKPFSLILGLVQLIKGPTKLEKLDQSLLRQHAFETS